MKRYSTILILLFTIVANAYSTTGKKEIRMLLQDSVRSLTDETDIYLDVGISPAYIDWDNEDAKKAFDTVLTVPQLYSLTSDGVPCYSNGYGPFIQSVTVGVGFRVAGGSKYVISSMLIDNFDPTTIIVLEDRVTGIYQDMREGSYSFEISGPQQTGSRFFLHISYPASLGIAPAGCANNNGAISVVQDSSILWSSIQLFKTLNDSNDYIVSYNNVKGSLSFSGLPQGSYNLAFVYGIYSTVEPIYITGSQITCNINVSNIYTSVGKPVMFYTQSQNATEYSWNMGDSTVIGGVANLEYQFNKIGTYTVSVLCTNNAGCSAYAYVTVYVTEATALSSINPDQVKVITDHNKIIINTGSESSYHYEIYSASGQIILSGVIDTPTSVISLPGEASGVYIARLKNSEGNLTRKIFLE